MSTRDRRLYPNRTILLVCDIQVKFSELVFPPYCKSGTFADGGPQEMQSTASKRWSPLQTRCSRSQRFASTRVLIRRPRRSPPSGRYLMSPSSSPNSIRKVRGVRGTPIAITRLLSLGLGPTVPELNVCDLGSLHFGTFDKTLFSMVIPPVEAILKIHRIRSVVILGIEVRLVCGAPLPRRSCAVLD